MNDYRFGDFDFNENNHFNELVGPIITKQKTRIHDLDELQDLTDIICFTSIL